MCAVIYCSCYECEWKASQLWTQWVTDRPRFLLLQVAGPSAGTTGCPRGRHHGKCGFCGSFERTTVQSQQRHLQFYCRFGYRRVWASLPWKALTHTDEATLCFCLQTSEPVPMLNNKPRIISALQFMLFKSSIFIFIQTLWDHDVKSVKVNTRKQRNVQHSHFFVMKQFPSIKSSSRKQKLCLGSVKGNVTCCALSTLTCHINHFSEEAAFIVCVWNVIFPRVQKVSSPLNKINFKQ